MQSCCFVTAPTLQSLRFSEEWDVVKKSTTAHIALHAINDDTPSLQFSPIGISDPHTFRADTKPAIPRSSPLPGRRSRVRILLTSLLGKASKSKYPGA